MDAMADQLIDRATAEGLQADARRDRLLVGWSLCGINLDRGNLLPAW
jgi:hypothetical protein